METYVGRAISRSQRERIVSSLNRFLLSLGMRFARCVIAKKYHFFLRQTLSMAVETDHVQRGTYYISLKGR